MAAATTSRQKGDPISRSSHRLEMRNNASPRKLPPIPVLIWSFFEGRVVSPAISQNMLPTKV